MASHNLTYLRLLSYTKLLTSHVNNGRHEQALSLFRQLHASFLLDSFAFPLALKSCASTRRPQLGASIHSLAVKSSLLASPFVACALVDVYGKCASLPSARKLFDELTQRNVIVWNAMISLYAHSSGHIDDALKLFDRINVPPNASTFNSIIDGLSGLDENGSNKAIWFYRGMWKWGLRPNLITLLSLLRASLRLANLSLIKEIHGFSIRINGGSHMHLKSGLVEAYGQCGCLRDARAVFMSMSERDVVAWSSLISSYALHGEARMALKIFAEMEEAKVKPDGIAFLEVLKACSHAGLADEALGYFAKMKGGYGVEADSDHYSCLIDVLSRAGRLYEAYEVIRDMPVKATAKAWGALLGACRTYGEVELGEIAGRVLFEIEPDNAANYVLLGRIYGNAGRHEESERVRREMEERGVKVAPGSSWVLYQD